MIQQTGPIIILILVLKFANSCSSEQVQTGNSTFRSNSFSVKGYVIPKDSISDPEIIPAGVSLKVPVLGRHEHPEEMDVQLINDPETLKVSIPLKSTPGQQELGLPLKVRAVDNPVLCKAPEVVIVKDAYSKDINPKNFSSYSKLQGLRTDQVRGLAQDETGNLWLGTDDGLTKYDGKYFSHYTTEQGLNNNLILSVAIDKNENVWFGSYGGGVSKFDGKYLYHYTISEGLVNNIVNVIYEDIEGNMWFGTDNGISKYDGTYFTNFTSEEGLCGMDVRSIVQDKIGRIWFLCSGICLSVFDGSSFFNYSSEEGLNTGGMSQLFKADNGDIWIASGKNSVIKYDGKDFIRFAGASSIEDNSARTIVQDDIGVLWIGYLTDGLSTFDGKYFTNYSEKDGLVSNMIRSSLMDSRGNLWFGTRGGGLTRFGGKIFTHLTSNEGLGQSRVMSIYEDESENIWLGTYGGYVTKCSFRDKDGVKTRYFTYFDEEDGLLNDRIYSIIKDSKGNMWFGTDGGGVSKFDGRMMTTYTTKEGLSGNAVRQIIEDSKGNLWFALYGKGVSKFDGKNFVNYRSQNGLGSDNILSVCEDSDGNIWFGTDNAGLTVFNGEDFIRYSKKEGFINNVIYCIYEDHDGILWFGTAGSGVVCYDGKVFTSFNGDKLSNSNHVLSLFQDSHNNLWMGTRYGPLVVDGGTLNEFREGNSKATMKNFGYEDGFIGLGCNLGAMAETSDGQIWIGTNDRLTVFNPDEEVRDTIAPNLELRNVRLFNEVIPWSSFLDLEDTSIILHNGMTVGKFKFTSLMKWSGLPEDLSLRYDNNYLTFSYIANSITNNNKLRYQYKLEGFEENWNMPTSVTDVSYGNLNHGYYVFKVKAMNEDGYWSKELSYPFTIRPPWWKTIWFFGFMVMLSIGIVYTFIKYRLRKLRRDKELLQVQVSEQTFEILQKNAELTRQQNEILEQNEAIEKSNEDLLKINAEKDKFFSIIAHDLRSPFSGFLGLTQQMAEELSSLNMSEIEEFAKSMNNSATNLYRLLENLLEWSRMKQGLIPFRPEEIQLKQLVEETALMLQNKSDEKTIEVLTTVAEHIIVFADENMLQAIMRNLLSNAIKFTHIKGNIIISAVSVLNKGVEICVRDTGIGMSPSMINNMFKPEFQTNRKGTEGEISTGLGLLLCKEFVEKHRGSIWIESEVGKGTAFYVNIPSKA